MNITITVTDKLFRKDIEDRFQDFFKRVIADIADSLNNGSTGLCGRYELETAVLLQNAFACGQYLEDVLTAEITELEDKHWEECRQIALYDDQLRKAMALLGRVKTVHAAAIRNGDAAVSTLTGRLLHDIEKLEKEISDSERRCSNG